MTIKTLMLCAAVLATPAFAANGIGRTQSGSANGLSWTAVSRIVGQTSTATIAGGGNPIYLPTQPQKAGVVQLLMDYGQLGAAVCSGSLGSDRRTIVTAAHCVSPLSSGLTPDKVTAIFWNGDPDAGALGNAAATAIDITETFVNPAYTGQVIDQNDIAVLRLGSAAPSWATAYDLYDEGDLTGKAFNVAGYGLRSSEGGALGTDLGTNRLREGDNTYEFRLGDPRWNGVLNFGTASEYAFSFVSDFDNGLAENDSSCNIAVAIALPAGTFCNTGLGAREVGIAGGDSGGPGFIDGKLASINSYGLTFGNDFGDVDLFLNASWGEFSGYVPIYLHSSWIGAVQAAIPEPGTWAMLIAGFGMVGGAMRRRQGVMA
ncbi:trypsin-like serine protease [Glacieibacterium frigidum]|uniref:Trypsin-like serine protease n=1 Tax=Glacieibacterium frigidum TaxID=2593303 RepID=A0A552UAA9_9SPHN|nr:PEPxxWA-CTERM sorting domain-containing protein [Glacieibacterium frigidum]TRW15154.1 trypsin-like serine protease [Glacieibacterium frigidum]